MSNNEAKQTSYKRGDETMSDKQDVFVSDDCELELVRCDGGVVTFTVNDKDKIAFTLSKLTEIIYISLQTLSKLAE